jgi:hypothetical protein
VVDGCHIASGSVAACGAYEFFIILPFPFCCGLVVVSLYAMHDATISFYLHLYIVTVLLLTCYNRGASTCIMLLHVLSALREGAWYVSFAVRVAYTLLPSIIFLCWGIFIVLGTPEVPTMVYWLTRLQFYGRSGKCITDLLFWLKRPMSIISILYAGPVCWSCTPGNGCLLKGCTHAHKCGVGCFCAYTLNSH